MRKRRGSLVARLQCPWLSIYFHKRKGEVGWGGFKRSLARPERNLREVEREVVYISHFKGYNNACLLKN